MLGKAAASSHSSANLASSACRGKTQRWCLQPRNAVLLEGHELIEYLQPDVVIVEQVERATQTDDGAYATELQASLLQRGYQVLAPCIAINHGMPPDSRLTRLLFGQKLF